MLENLRNFLNRLKVLLNVFLAPSCWVFKFKRADQLIGFLILLLNKTTLEVNFGEIKSEDSFDVKVIVDITKEIIMFILPVFNNLHLSHNQKVLKYLYRTIPVAY